MNSNVMIKTTHTSIIRFTIFSNEQLRLWLQKLPLDPRESEPVAQKSVLPLNGAWAFMMASIVYLFICIFLGRVCTITLQVLIFKP